MATKLRAGQVAPSIRRIKSDIASLRRTEKALYKDKRYHSRIEVGRAIQILEDLIKDIY